MVTPQPLNQRLASRLRSSASAPITSLPAYETVRSAFLRFAFHADFDGAGAWERFAPLWAPLPAQGTLLISESKRNEVLYWADLIDDNEDLAASADVIQMILV